MARFALFPLLAMAVLATGCCLPPLSGRFDHSPADAKQVTNRVEGHAASANSAHARSSPSRHRRHLVKAIGHRFGWHGFGPGPETPPGQQVPLPRFHPVPVRPVFEPQFDYPLPLVSGPPLAPIVTPESLGVPTPVQPVPDPA